jgi:phosphoserine phosphatase RsbU/P
MDAVSRSRWADAFGQILRETQFAQTDELIDYINAALAPLDLRTSCYLVNEEQTDMRPMPASGTPSEGTLPIEGTGAGRCFVTLTALPGHDDDGTPTLCLPLLDGTERLGVVQVTGPSVHEPDVQEECRNLLTLIAHMVAVASRYGDIVPLVRRTRPMSIGSELLQAMLPPLTFTTRRVSISCILQPFYEMSGDAFDYAVDGAYAHFSLIDAIGHGLSSTMMASTALSALRATRRGGGDLLAMSETVDEVLDREFGHSAFVTALLGRLNLDTGQLLLMNAGHFAPVLIRRDKTIGELSGGHRLPLGLRDSPPRIAEHTLERGDNLLLYTDGVVEARGPDGEMFGIDRLTGLIEQGLATELPAAEVVRQAARAVIDYGDGRLRDDSTLMLVQWTWDARELMQPRLAK